MTGLDLPLVLAFLAMGTVVGAAADRLPLAYLVARIRAASFKGLHAMTRDAVSDHWKERVLRLCTMRLLSALARLLMWLFVLLGGITCLTVALDIVLPGLWAGLSTLWGMLALTAGSVLMLVLARSSRNV